MPALGEIKTRESGRRCIWAACVHCGRERWVQLLRCKPKSDLCAECGRFEFRGLNKAFVEEIRYEKTHKGQ